MRNDLTDITLIVDRSGSMYSCREDAQGGINSFIEEQKKADGEALLSLVQFDTLYDFVHKGVNIKDVPHYELMPRGGTALLDAVGRAITETGERLKNMNEKDRPGCVIVVIVTDGQENSSKEFKKSQIQEMIKLQTDTYKWQFTFLGADANSFADAVSLGISSFAHYNPNKAGQAYNVASSNVSRMRRATMMGQNVVNKYTPEELTSLS